MTCSKNERTQGYFHAKRINILGALDIEDFSVTTAFAEENDILLLFLPPYAPNLNLIERLWKFTKKHLVNNTYHEDYAQFVNATYSFFNNLGKYQQELSSLFTQKF